MTFHARTLRDALGHRTAEVGFMRARAHTLVSIEQCPVLAPELDGAVLTARRVAALLRDLDKPLDILITATEAGLDVDLRGCGACRQGCGRQRLVWRMRRIWRGCPIMATC